MARLSFSWRCSFSICKVALSVFNRVICVLCSINNAFKVSISSGSYGIFVMRVFYQHPPQNVIEVLDRPIKRFDNLRLYEAAS